MTVPAPWRTGLAAAVLAVALGAAAGLAVPGSDGRPAPAAGASAGVPSAGLPGAGGTGRSEGGGTAQARPLPEQGGPSRGAPGTREAPAQRTAEIDALLAARARAVLARDRAGFLSSVDPRATAFAEREGALFDALAQVPLGAWTYTLHPDDAQADDPALDARYGTWWGPRVVLGVALQGIDTDPAESEQALTFVRRSGRWFVAADDDFAAHGAMTAREIWDGGPVAVVRGARCLVLGHPASLPQMRQLADDVDAAVPRVTAVWGTGWPQQVAVVVPADQDELARLVTTRGSLSPIAALAVAGPVRGGTARGGDRVVVNPVNMARLAAVGRRIVLTHEVTHVASRSATGPSTPLWLSEGLADHVGYLGAGIPVRAAAAELRDDLRAGRLPAALPTAADWTGDNPDLSATYEQAWLAVELMVRTYGQDEVLTFYRDLGARSGADPAGDLEQVLRTDLGTDVAQLTAGWQASLRRQLG